jgi:uncharacterized protein YlxW (UPF0749 family)
VIAGAQQGVDWVGLGQVLGAVAALIVAVGGGVTGVVSSRRSASTSEVEGLRDENRNLREEINIERTARRNEITQLREEYDQRLDEMTERHERTAERAEKCEQERDQLRRLIAAYGNGG